MSIKADVKLVMLIWSNPLHSMDVEEATDVAVERRKFLLNRIFQPHPIPMQDKKEENDDDDDDN